MSIRCSAAGSTESFARSLVQGLRFELDLTPKPGLVDRWDSGSHQDLSYPILSRSIDLLAEYFLQCVQALNAGAPVEHLRALGRDTESRMFRLFSTNTHRGAIFLGGLMLAGVHRAACDDADAIRAGIRAAAQELFDTSLPQSTNGAVVRSQYQVGGIISEALRGLPAVFDVGVPALKYGEQLGMRQRNTQLLAMSRLMQTVEDTTTLRRCGEFGLQRLCDDGRRLERLLVGGSEPTAFLVALNRDYRISRMTMGGVADLLGLAFASHYRPDPEIEPPQCDASGAARRRHCKTDSESLVALSSASSTLASTMDCPS